MGKFILRKSKYNIIKIYHWHLYYVQPSLILDIPEKFHGN